MTGLDYFALVVALWSTVLGATRGILKSFISVTFTVAGLVSAAFLYPYSAKLFDGFTSSAEWAALLGFGAIFLVVLTAGMLFSVWLHRRIRNAKLSWLNHSLGGGFGLLRGWLICSALYMALTAFPIRLSTVEEAKFAPALIEGTKVIAYLTSREMRERFAEGYAAVKKSWSKKN
jgi:membrane protein required for colicin V production